MRPEVDWRRNLAALWFAELTAIFGFSFAFPFLPLFLKELGIHRPSDLALWTGIAGGASGAALAVMSPIWGALADRYGRKPMLVRAMAGGALSVGLMGLARGALDLVALRLIQGASSGTIAAATALVASGTPRHRIGWALGILSSSVAVGGAVGPLVGGLAASVFGLRAIFLLGGVLLAVATVPVIILVREPPRTSPHEDTRPALAALRSVGPGTVATVAALVVCQGLLQVCFSGFQPLIVLRLLEHLRSGTAAVTGIAFAASGLASALAAVIYANLARRFGYRNVAFTAAVLLAGAEAVTGFAPAVSMVVAATALSGVFYGMAGPSVSAMLGLETPADAQARVFGFGSSAMALGFGMGPFGGGLLASRLGVSAAIAIIAVFALILAAVLALMVREPSR